MSRRVADPRRPAARDEVGAGERSAMRAASGVPSNTISRRAAGAGPMSMSGRRRASRDGSCRGRRAVTAFAQECIEARPLHVARVCRPRRLVERERVWTSGRRGRGELIRCTSPQQGRLCRSAHVADADVQVAKPRTDLAERSDRDQWRCAAVPASRSKNWRSDRSAAARWQPSARQRSRCGRNHPTPTGMTRPFGASTASGLLDPAAKAWPRA